MFEKDSQIVTILNSRTYIHRIWNFVKVYEYGKLVRSLFEKKKTYTN